MRRLLLLLPLSAGLIVSSNAFAQEHGRGHGRDGDDRHSDNRQNDNRRNQYAQNDNRHHVYDQHARDYHDFIRTKSARGRCIGSNNTVTLQWIGIAPQNGSVRITGTGAITTPIPYSKSTSADP